MLLILGSRAGSVFIAHDGTRGVGPDAAVGRSGLIACSPRGNRWNAVVLQDITSGRLTEICTVHAGDRRAIGVLLTKITNGVSRPGAANAVRWSDGRPARWVYLPSWSFNNRRPSMRVSDSCSRLMTMAASWTRCTWSKLAATVSSWSWRASAAVRATGRHGTRTTAGH
jgi:hypothetical protein